MSQLHAIEAVRRACREADGLDPLDEAAALHLKHHGLDGTSVWTRDDSGFALRRAGVVDIAVSPEARGRGLGRGLAEDAVADPGPLSAWSHGDHPAAAHLAAALGFERTRELWMMRLAAGVPLEEVEAPTGVEIRGYRPSDAGDLLLVNAAAFRAHPEQGGLDEAGLTERMAEPWFDPDGLLVAVDGDRLLGFHWTKQHPEGVGEVYVVGIDPDAQGRGLGRLLTLAGLHRLHDTGAGEIVLYVESDNAAAVAVYSRVGFTHTERDTHVQYARD